MSRLLIRMLLCLVFCMSAGSIRLMADDSSPRTVIDGVVIDNESKKAMEGVSITIPGTNIGTVTNAEGVFSLKLPPTGKYSKIRAEHIGYTASVTSLRGSDTRLTIRMSPSSKMLREFVVRTGKPDEIVAEALERIPENYPEDRNLFTAFYRETIRKGKRYIGVAEAVVDVMKMPYTRRVIYGDRVRIQKGRNIISQDMRDTLSVKIMGGPTMPVILDFVKNTEFVFGIDDLGDYDFEMERPVSLDDRLQYTIRFEPRVRREYAMFKGTLYIDQESLAFTKADISLDVSDRELATNVILRKKPRGLHFRPQEINYSIVYKLIDGKAYINYIATRLRFKCDWRRRLFSSGYTTEAEMVMVDRLDNVSEGISHKMSFGKTDIFADEVDNYWDPDFWADYNIIEPTETLDKAVDRLRKANAELKK